MDFTTRFDFLTKLSNAVLLYAKKKKCNKYIIKKTVKSLEGWKHEVYLLDEKKLFEHSSYFKNEKKRLISRRGDKQVLYYNKLREFLNTNHYIYTQYKYYIFKILNYEKSLKRADFILLNEIYKITKNVNGKTKGNISKAS